MYAVSIGEYVRTGPRAKNPYRCKTRTKYTTDDEQRVAEDATDVMRQAGKGMRFSGMEEFREGHAVFNDGHECPEDGKPSDECERLELESCREWIESAIQQLAPGASEELGLHLPDRFTEFVITRKS